MGLTLGDIKREVKASMGNRDDLDARMNQIINLSQTRLARTYDFSEMLREEDFTVGSTAVPDDDRRITVPAGLKDMHSIFLIDGTNSRKLEYITTRKWDQSINLQQMELTGRPAKYTRFNDEYILWKIPDETYTIRMRYSKWPAELVKETDKSDFNHKDDLIIMLALIWGFQSLGELERANHAFSVYKTLLQEAINEDDTQVDRVIAPNNPETGFNSIRLGQTWRDPFVRGY